MKTKFTEKQGQYLAFIYNYSQINGRPPSEADIQRFFMTTPPTIHQMIVKLEEMGLISRVPGQARSIQLLIEPEKLPILRKQTCLQNQPNAPYGACLDSGRPFTASAFFVSTPVSATGCD